MARYQATICVVLFSACGLSKTVNTQTHATAQDIKDGSPEKSGDEGKDTGTDKAGTGAASDDTAGQGNSRIPSKDATPTPKPPSKDDAYLKLLQAIPMIDYSGRRRVVGETMQDCKQDVAETFTASLASTKTYTYRAGDVLAATSVSNVPSAAVGLVNETYDINGRLTKKELSSPLFGPIGRFEATFKDEGTSLDPIETRKVIAFNGNGTVNKTFPDFRTKTSYFSSNKMIIATLETFDGTMTTKTTDVYDSKSLQFAGRTVTGTSTAFNYQKDCVYSAPNNFKCATTSMTGTANGSYAAKEEFKLVLVKGKADTSLKTLTTRQEFQDGSLRIVTYNDKYLILTDKTTSAGGVIDDLTVTYDATNLELVRSSANVRIGRTNPYNCRVQPSY